MSEPGACPACNTPAADGAKFCPLCGTSFDSEPVPGTEVPRKNNGCLLWLAASIVLGLLVGTLLIYVSDSNDPSTPYEHCVNEATRIAIEHGEYGWGSENDIREFCRDSNPDSAP